MDPALEKLSKALEKGLRKGATAKAYLASLSEATETLLHLDLGMLEGAVLPKERREALTAAILDFARDCLVKAATLDSPKASRWLSELAIYRKPKTVDFADWARLVEEAKTAAPAAAPLDLSSEEVPEALARALVRSWVSEPRTRCGIG